MDKVLITPVTGGNNGDRDREWTVGADTVVGIGSFHKTLPQNEYGEVDPAAFSDFTQIIDAGLAGNFENVAPGAFNGMTAALLVNPQAGLAEESHGIDPCDGFLRPAPGVCSTSTAAEMTELYWMALHRDIAFDTLHADAAVHGAAVTELKDCFTAAVQDAADPGHLTTPEDLRAAADGTPDIRPETLYRVGLKDEERGPLVSQLFLHDVAYGAQLIVQKQHPYATGIDYLTSYHDWIRAQKVGRDFNGDPYPDANDPRDPNTAFEGGDTTPDFRRIATMRDLARFVHKDALHQAYFNAALLLLSWGAPVDPGNPYPAFQRQAGFGTLGGPHLLTLVSEVAARALKLVWRQKWQVHLRLRPEVYAGRMQMQEQGHNGVTRAYGLPGWVLETEAAQAVHDRHGTRFLPMAFTSGSPAHPAYGAGHATVAGACITILKAWFDETQPLKTLLETAQAAGRGLHPLTGQPVRIVQPSLTGVHRDAFGQPVSDGTGGFELPSYQGSDIGSMTVGGELNKLASNVAMGRSMGGVHWRSDNTRSLRLGEQLAVHILQKMVNEVAEDVTLSFTNFDGVPAIIAPTARPRDCGCRHPAADATAEAAAETAV